MGKLPEVGILTTELLAVRNSSSRFQPFVEARIQESAAILLRYGLPTVEYFRKADKQAMSYLFGDLRQREQRTFHELSFPIALSQHLLPHIQGGPIKVSYTELDMPPALRTYAPSLQFPEAFFRPTQSMVNFARKELAEASGKEPPFKPLLIPELPASPRMPDTADHAPALTNWANYSKTRQNKLPTELSIQSFLL